MEELQAYFENILAHLDDMAKRTIFMMGMRYGQEKSREQTAAEHGNDFQLLPNLTEEVEKMLLEIKISGSVRERKNGLIEFRNPQFGSVYGRSVDELREKLQQKIRYAKAHVKKPPKKKKAPLLSEFFEQVYFPYKKRNLAPRTIKGMEYNIAFIKKTFDKPLTDYSPKDIETFLLSITATRKAQIIQGLLNNIFNKAITEGVIRTNPCTVLDRITHETDEGTALTFEEQEAFFKALFSDTRMTVAQKCYFVFVYLTGTRRNEALSVTDSDVDFAKSVLHIRGTKTDGSDRYLPLFPLAAKVLQKLPQQGKYFPFKEHTASSLFSRLSDTHRLHDLRHSFGTIQICVNTVDEKTVSLWMGHSDIKTTLKHYTHPEQLDRGTFLRGDLSENEKKAAYKAAYTRILAAIEAFLDSLI